jgi:hypothetical protein
VHGCGAHKSLIFRDQRLIFRGGQCRPKFLSTLLVQI